MPRKRHPREAAAGAAVPGGPDRQSGWVCVGVIAKPKGVRGLVRIACYTARPADLMAYGPVRDGPGGRVIALELREAGPAGVVAAVAGVSDRDAAETLRGTRLYVPRAALPETGVDEFFHADLIGLSVELADGTRIGTVRALHDFGAGDILEVARAGGDTAMLPFTREAVPEIDIGGGRIVVAPPEQVTAGQPSAERTE